jgi:hypothetical protein
MHFELPTFTGSIFQLNAIAGTLLACFVAVRSKARRAEPTLQRALASAHPAVSPTRSAGALAMGDLSYDRRWRAPARLFGAGESLFPLPGGTRSVDEVNAVRTTVPLSVNVVGDGVALMTEER